MSGSESFSKSESDLYIDEDGLAWPREPEPDPDEAYWWEMDSETFNREVILALGNNDPRLSTNVWLDGRFRTVDGDEGGSGEWAEFVQALARNTTVTSLKLSANEIEDLRAGELAVILAIHPALCSLTLDHNQITDTGGSELTQAMVARNTDWPWLDLGYNRLTDAFACELARFLATNTIILTSLSLNDNHIGDVGAIELARILANNTPLTYLRLGSNVGDAGACALARALETNSTLTSLHLSNNKIGDDGAGELLQSWATNSTLTSLEMEDNHLSAACCQ